jgi:ribonuclease HI
MHNYLKVNNTDGAFREASLSRGWGFVLRNDRGVVVEAGCGHLQKVSNALHVESLAALQAVRITTILIGN